MRGWGYDGGQRLILEIQFQPFFPTPILFYHISSSTPSKSTNHTTQIHPPHPPSPPPSLPESHFTSTQHPPTKINFTLLQKFSAVCTCLFFGWGLVGSMVLCALADRLLRHEVISKVAFSLASAAIVLFVLVRGFGGFWVGRGFGGLLVGLGVVGG